MQLCYKIYYDIVHEVAWEAEKEQGRELVRFFWKGASDIESVLLSVQETNTYLIGLIE